MLDLLTLLARLESIGWAPRDCQDPQVSLISYMRQWGPRVLDSTRLPERLYAAFSGETLNAPGVILPRPFTGLEFAV
jgi:hypothetical protein